GGILESADELHTEYSVGNFKENRSHPQKVEAQYFGLKEFWYDLTKIGGVDFDLLGDRTKMFDSLISEFGFSGFLEYVLLYAHSSGKSATFETFYSGEARPAISMLIEQ